MNELFLSRQSGLFVKELGLRLVIIGVGGIGSNAAHMIASTGMAREIHLVDFDQVGDENVYPGFFSLSDVGRKKADAVEMDIIRRLDAANMIVHSHDSMMFVDFARAHLVLVCTDNIESRAEAWHYCKGLPLWYMDGRMGGADCELYCFRADNEQAAAWYEPELEGEFSELACGEKATAALTKGALPLMIGQCLFDMSNDVEPSFHQTYSLRMKRLGHPQRVAT